MEISVEIDELVRVYEVELDRSLPTWTSRMEAIIAGAVDYDDMQPLIEGCITAAGLASQTEWYESAFRCCDDLCFGSLNARVTARDVLLKLGNLADSDRDAPYPKS